jgi:hypothetical protein
VLLHLPGPAGTTLGYGWAVNSRGAVQGVHGPTHYLIQPEQDGAPQQWMPHSAIDFRPRRREQVPS